jgi:hypothetical protein
LSVTLQASVPKRLQLLLLELPASARKAHSLPWIRPCCQGPSSRLRLHPAFKALVPAHDTRKCLQRSWSSTRRSRHFKPSLTTSQRGLLLIVP